MNNYIFQIDTIYLESDIIPRINEILENLKKSCELLQNTKIPPNYVYSSELKLLENNLNHYYEFINNYNKLISKNITDFEELNNQMLVDIQNITDVIIKKSTE